MDPTSLLPKLSSETPQAFATRIRAAVKEIEDKRDPPIYLPRNEQMMRFWKAHRPTMWAQLERLKLAEALATYLQAKMLTAEDEYLAGGMARTDAREQAEQEWLLMEPESEDAPADDAPASDSEPTR